MYQTNLSIYLSRFRYECEGKGAGALQGKSSTPEHKNFPKIKVIIILQDCLI